MIGLFSSLLLALQVSGAIYVGPTTDEHINWAVKESFRGDRVPFCRGYYTSDRYEENGSGWWTDYPGADHNFLVRLGELTKMRPGVAVVVKLDSPLLMHCPVLYMTDVGTMLLTGPEVLGLRTYLQKGGLLWVDDFWGTQAWDQWIREIRRVLPSQRMIDVPSTHPILTMPYVTGEIWQMPTVGLWYGIEGARNTSERGDDSSTASLRALVDDVGRLLVLSTHNTDIADGWEEDKGEYTEYLNKFSYRAYGLGFNIFVYALVQ